MQYDVIVIGGGVVGAATTYALAQAGCKVLMIERFEPGHTHGSSHGDGRVVRFNYTEAIYVEMAKLAYPAWEALGERAGKPMFQKTGLVEYGPAGCEAMAESEANLKRYGVAYERLSAAAGRERFPQFAFEDGAELLYQGDGAVAFATPAVLAMWQFAQEDGATTVTGERVVAVEPDANSVTVRGESGKSWTATKLVIAAGAWANRLLAPLGVEIPLEVTQEVLTYFPPTGDVSHRVGYMPVAIDYHTESPFYLVPQVDVPGMKVGWHHTGSEAAPENREAASRAIVEGAQGWIDRLFPYLEREPLEVQTCLYTNTPDYHFVMDHHPEHEHIVIGAGFSGHGFKFGPVLGQFLAQIAQEEAPLLSLEPFSLERFKHPEKLQKRVGA